jgi:phage/plasmid-associated DNA primase
MPDIGPGYADSIKFKALAAHSNQNDPAIVRLKGKRFVSIAEGDKNLRIDAALIKRLTGGGDRITAAEKYANDIDLYATWKSWLGTNQTLNMDVDDDLAWQRVVSSGELGKRYRCGRFSPEASVHSDG